MPIIRPVEGRRIHREDGSVLPVEGARVNLTTYWRRLQSAGDVVEVKECSVFEKVIQSNQEEV